uniref:Alpha-S1-casein n=1 Tax=Equus caballus TaxID=9796 RepID=A0A5F5PV89_HORSE
MKLLILTCLVAVALARPKLPHRQPEIIQNEQDSREHTPREEYINELNRQRELLKEKQKDEHKDTSNESTEEYLIEDPEQQESSSTSSSEEQLRRLSKYNQLQLQAIHAQEQLLRMKENSQVPFQPSYQLDVYPYAAWFHPAQIMQHVAYSPFHDTAKLIASENSEKTDIIPEW